MRRIMLSFVLVMLMICASACADGGSSSDIPRPADEAAQSSGSVPENLPDTESPGGTAETELDRFIGELDGYICAAAYVGYTENADVNSVRECAEKCPAAEKYPFVADISDDRIILAGGGEIYCIIPAGKAAKVTVNSLDHDENGTEITGDELYSGGAPILISCNISDIMSNASVSVSDGDNTVKFSPFLSLRDGRLALPENSGILDFSEYEF